MTFMLVSLKVFMLELKSQCVCVWGALRPMGRESILNNIVNLGKGGGM